MSNALVQHAQKVVWQEPAQDYQYNVGLARLTLDGGVIHSQNVLWHEVYVPERGSRKWFHMYQVGQIPPKLFGLALRVGEWQRIDRVCDDFALLIDLYLETGAVIPRTKAWMLIDHKRDVLVAIENDKKIDYGRNMNVDDYSGMVLNEKITLDNSRVMMRFYSNAHFSNASFRDLAANPNNPIQMTYRLINDEGDYEKFSNDCDKIIKGFRGVGDGIYYEDGFVRGKPFGFSDNLRGKILGFMWDESFKLSKMYALEDVGVFESIRDNGLEKYLIITDEVYDIIDYHDDIDFFVVSKVGRTWKGVYLSRVREAAVRQVTHSAYSIDSTLVQYYIDTHEFLQSADECFIYMMVRQGGKLSGLYNQKNRIEELYKIPATETIEEAMINTISLVPEWRAAELENSEYIRLMGADNYQLKTELVQDAYGYSAVTQFMCPPIGVPLRRGSTYQLLVPPALQISDNVDTHGRRAVFTYDGQGQLTSYFNDSSSDTLITLPPDTINTATVEMFNAVIDDDAGIWINLDVQNNEIEQYGFRCYLCTLRGGEPDEQWEDVTHQTAWYNYTPGTAKSDAKIEWDWDLLSAAGLYPAVKSNARVNIFTHTRHKAADTDGVIKLVVKTRQWWGRNKVYKAHTVPPAQVTVFGNGKTLIEDIDYYLNWPVLVIVNLEVNAAESVEIIVRSYGCGKPIEEGPAVPYKPREVGFVRNGRLSVDGKYNIHNDKNIKITVGGKFKRREEVSLSENDLYTDEAILVPDGRPYAIEDYILPIENFTVGKRTNEFYEEVFDIETRVSEYISHYLHDSLDGPARVEGMRWQVISPFLTAMIYAIRHGYASDGNTGNNFDTLEANYWATPFEHLLEYDPAAKMADTNYIHIAPHAYPGTLEVTQKQYELLETIIKLKLHDLVDLSRYLTIIKEDK